jgi:hypothetical protein
MNRVLLLCVFPLLLACSSLAQDHNHNVDVIDGADHPELIPDAVAFRMFLIAASASPNPTQDEIDRQSAYLSRIGLNDSDKAQAVALLASFKSQYKALIDNYNLQATAAQLRGEAIDQTLFLQQRDDLVATTRASLTRALSADGGKKFEAHVQGEKSKMKTVKSKEGQ